MAPAWGSLLVAQCDLPSRGGPAAQLVNLSLCMGAAVLPLVRRARFRIHPKIRMAVVTACLLLLFTEL
jgi:hypothetical protein